MKLRGKNPEAAAYRAAAANAGLAVGRAVTGVATGNLGFFTDVGHDISDVVSLSAKARAMETGERTSSRLRMGAAGLFLAGGLFGVGSGVYSLANDRAEDASPVAVATALAAAGASVEIARRTHTHLAEHEGSSDEPVHHRHAKRDTLLHLGSDAVSSGVYAAGLGVQSLTGVEQFGGGSVLASGIISTGFAAYTLYRVRKTKKPTQCEL